MGKERIGRRTFLGQAVALAMLGALPAIARANPQARPPQARSQGLTKFDFHVHLGRDQQEMFAMTRDKVPAAVKYLIGQMDTRKIERSMIVAVEPVFSTELYLEAAKLEPRRLLVACSMIRAA